VRYRAWQPPTRFTRPSACTPLVFESARRVVRSLLRAVARITSRTPAGSRTTLFPRNALEAESRRIARFFAFGHSQGSAPCRPRASEELPLTLDLRRAAP
jgi:uncharacterized protein (DUF2126 family)